MATDKAIRNAVHKAGEVRPAAFKLCEGFWACPSKTSPGTGYMIEVYERRVSCECEGFKRQGVCYHSAYVAIEEGLMPVRFLLDDLQVKHPADSALLRQAPKGRTALWA